MTSLTNVNFTTPDGNHFLTAINGGGIGPVALNGLATNGVAGGPDGSFQLLVQDAVKGTFALGTSDGTHFVTASNGGSVGNANPQFPQRDPGNTFPLHTDAVKAGAWESFTLTVNSSTRPWSVQIQAPNGDYLYAVNGGGIGDGGSNDTPIHTDAVKIGPDEIWSINQVLFYNWLVLTFHTTDDDLSGGVPGRGASWLGASFTLADGTGPMNLNPVNVNAQGAVIAFASPSWNTCWVQLPSSVTSDYFTQMALTLFQPPNSFPAGTDEWHFDGLEVSLAQTGPPPPNVANPPIDPTFKLITLGNYNHSSTGFPNRVLSAANPTVIYNLPDLSGHA